MKATAREAKGRFGLTAGDRKFMEREEYKRNEDIWDGFESALITNSRLQKRNRFPMLECVI
jgi:hypothetical protein